MSGDIIEPLGLESLIKRQGILLEHKTELCLLEYFSKRRSKAQFDWVRRHAVGERKYSALLSKSIETDVYFDVDINHEKNKCGLRPIEWSNGKRTLGQEYWPDTPKINTHILVECKGHPSDGFLLARRAVFPSDASEKYESAQYFHVYGKDKWHHLQRTQANDYLADWAYFYRLNPDKSRWRENKKREGLELGFYQEEKDKFLDATVQTADNITSVLENLDSISALQDGRGYYIRIIPIIVTNAPLCLMSIGSEKVDIDTVPWFTYLHHFVSPHTSLKRREEFRYLYVARFDYLTQFLDAFLSMESFVSPPPVGHSAIHSFSLNDEEADSLHSPSS